MRLACLFVPLFPLAARLRSEPELVHEAVVIVEGNGNAAHVVAATRRARKGGIRTGFTLPQARAIFPKLIARARDAECERAAQEALLEVAESFSPRIEDAGEGMAWLDLAGLEMHYPGEDREKTMGQSLIRAVEKAGLPVRVGIAGSKLAARVAAELPQSPRIVPEGEEPAFLAPLPLARLTPELNASTALQRWGIQTIGELARLPEGEVASRLGETGRDLHWSARGVDPKPLMPRMPPTEFREGMDLEWPLCDLEPFLFIARAALDRLTQRLEMHGLACKRLEFTLKLEPDGYHVRAIELPAPTRDVKTLLTLMKLDLEATPPGAPVSGFTLVAHPDRLRRAQLSLFGPAAMSPDKLATTIARLVALVGDGRVGMPAVVDGHVPERFAIAEFAPPPPPDMRRAPRRGRGLLSVRVLRPPIALEVITNESRGTSEGQTTVAPIPVSIRTLTPPREDRPPTPGTTPQPKPLVIEGRVRVASGPWRVEQSWWDNEPALRDYWDVELSSGSVCRIFCERATNAWFVDGMYD